MHLFQLLLSVLSFLHRTQFLKLHISSVYWQSFLGERPTCTLRHLWRLFWFHCRHCRRSILLHSVSDLHAACQHSLMPHCNHEWIDVTLDECSNFQSVGSPDDTARAFLSAFSTYATFRYSQVPRTIVLPASPTFDFVPVHVLGYVLKVMNVTEVGCWLTFFTANVQLVSMALLRPVIRSTLLPRIFVWNA